MNDMDIFSGSPRVTYVAKRPFGFAAHTTAFRLAEIKSVPTEDPEEIKQASTKARRYIENADTKDTDRVLVYRTPEGSLLGAAGWRILRGRAYLVWYWSDPKARGMGIGKDLLRGFLREAKAHGLSRAVSYTHITTVRSSNAFMSCGFRLSSRKEIPGVSPKDWLVWARPLGDH